MLGCSFQMYGICEVMCMKNDFADNGIVTVIIPVYQAECYLRRCVESVINQTYKKIEIILIDDGSADNSLAICYELADEDSRIQVYHHGNMGVAVTRNKGLEYARGEYIYFLDSDDWIDENTLFVMVQSLEEHEADLCICGFKYVNDSCEKDVCLPEKTSLTQAHFIESYFWKLYENAVLFNIGTKLYKRKIIVENNISFCTDMIVYEDIRFCLEYMDKVQQVFLCNEPYYYYYNNSESVTHVYKPGFWESTSVYCSKLLERFEEYSISLKKAILMCLYRAYLYESHNPFLKKADFSKTINEKCFSFVDKLDLKACRFMELSLDQKVFAYLLSHKKIRLLWLMSSLISIKNK